MEQFIRSKEQITETFALLSARAHSFWNWDESPVMHISIKPAKSTRTLSQNALYWEWVETLATYLTKNGRANTKDKVHEMLCHKFLGYRDVMDPNGKKVGVTLNTTTSPQLDVGEMSHYMSQVDQWGQEIGCYLPTPQDSQYDRVKKRQNR